MPAPRSRMTWKTCGSALVATLCLSAATARADNPVLIWNPNPVTTGALPLHAVMTSFTYNGVAMTGAICRPVPVYGATNPIRSTPGYVVNGACLRADPFRYAFVSTTPYQVLTNPSDRALNWVAGSAATFATLSAYNDTVHEAPACMVGSGAYAGVIGWLESDNLCWYGQKPILNGGTSYTNSYKYLPNRVAEYLQFDISNSLCSGASNVVKIRNDGNLNWMTPVVLEVRHGNECGGSPVVLTNQSVQVAAGQTQEVLVYSWGTWDTIQLKPDWYTRPAGVFDSSSTCFPSPTQLTATTPVFDGQRIAIHASSIVKSGSPVAADSYLLNDKTQAGGLVFGAMPANMCGALWEVKTYPATAQDCQNAKMNTCTKMTLKASAGTTYIGVPAATTGPLTALQSDGAQALLLMLDRTSNGGHPGDIGSDGVETPALTNAGLVSFPWSTSAALFPIPTDNLWKQQTGGPLGYGLTTYAY